MFDNLAEELLDLRVTEKELAGGRARLCGVPALHRASSSAAPVRRARPSSGGDRGAAAAQAVVPPVGRGRPLRPALRRLRARVRGCGGRAPRATPAAAARRLADARRRGRGAGRACPACCGARARAPARARPRDRTRSRRLRCGSPPLRRAALRDGRRRSHGRGAACTPRGGRRARSRERSGGRAYRPPPAGERRRVASHASAGTAGLPRKASSSSPRRATSCRSSSSGTGARWSPAHRGCKCFRSTGASPLSDRSSPRGRRRATSASDSGAIRRSRRSATGRPAITLAAPALDAVLAGLAAHGRPPPAGRGRHGRGRRAHRGRAGPRAPMHAPLRVSRPALPCVLAGGAARRRCSLERHCRLSRSSRRSSASSAACRTCSLGPKTSASPQRGVRARFRMHSSAAAPGRPCTTRAPRRSAKQWSATRRASSIRTRSSSPPRASSAIARSTPHDSRSSPRRSIERSDSPTSGSTATCGSPGSRASRCRRVGRPGFPRNSSTSPATNRSRRFVARRAAASPAMRRSATRRSRLCFSSCSSETRS